jgi:hypothetical protein
MELYPEHVGDNFSETSVLIRPARRHIPEDAIIQADRFDAIYVFMQFSALQPQFGSV